jgi:hypothetical protein
MQDTAKCPKCNATIEKGVLLCGNCKTQLDWKNGVPRVSFAQKLDNTANGLGKFGCLMTLFITIPILFIFCTLL